MSDSARPQAIDPDMAGTDAALRRAGRRARDLARLTKTAIVYVKDGVLVEDYEMTDFPDDEPIPPVSATG